MKTFKDYLAEQATLPQTHAGVKGAVISIKKQADGTQWCQGSVVAITPDNEADAYNLKLTDGNTVRVPLTPPQATAISAGEYVTMVHDGNEFFFGENPSDHSATQ